MPKAKRKRKKGKKKAVHVPFGIALMVILAASTVPVMLFSSVFFYQVKRAEAFLGQPVALEIRSFPIKCIADPGVVVGKVTCEESCLVCGDARNINVCTSLFEIQAIGLNLNSQLALTQGIQAPGLSALCVTAADIPPPKGGNYFDGTRCIGILQKLGFFHKLGFNFGCSLQ